MQGLEIVHVAPKNASQQATSRRSSPQEVVGRNDSRCPVLAGGRNWSGPVELTATGAQAAIRRRRRNHDDVQMGELSASGHFERSHRHEEETSSAQGPIVAICLGIPTRSFLVG